MQFSDNVAQLEPSATLALAAQARQLKADGIPVIDLSAGEPRYRAPEFATRAAVQAMAAGKTGYPPTPGIPELREAIAAYVADTTAIETVDPADVIVGAGVKQCLFNCTFALFGPGDEVLIPAPFWPSYPAIIELAGARPVVVDTTWDEEFILDVDRLEGARTDRTRGLFLNSPSNPTGVVYDADTLEAIIRWCERHGIWILSDEIYRRLGYVESVPSVFDVTDLPERVVLLDGVSKAFCMPGFRIGYAVGPKELIARASDLQGQTTSGAVGPSQYAAAAALGQAQDRERFVADLLGRLRGLREQGLAAFAEIDALEVRPPQGAIYFYARLRDSDRSSLEVAGELLEKRQVACIPGEPFGSPGHLRFNFAVEEETLEEGLRRIRDYFQS